MRTLVAPLALGALLLACSDRSPSPGAAPPARNLLLITLDTTRADHLGCYGCSTVATPAIDGLAQEGVLFETAITSVPTTLPSHTSIMTSLWPLRHGIRDNGIFRLSSEALTLAEVLRDRGYHTGAVVSAFVLDAQFGLDQGFETYDDHVSAQVYNAAGTQDRRADEVTTLGLRFLDQRGGRPFFLRLHYFDPHGPYAPPPPFKERYAGRPYDGEIAYTDTQLARLLAGLQQRALAASTLVVLTADHGESLGEHGERTHGYFVYDATAHVPLIMRGPDLPSGQRVRGVAQLIDIAPTALELLQAEAPPAFQGKTLVPFLRDHVDLPATLAYLETYAPYFNFGWSPLKGLRDARYKYVRAPRPELYDLLEDPLEQHDLTDREPEVAARMARVLDQLLAAQAGPSLAQANAPTPAEQDKLKALGYTATAATLDHDPTGPDPKDMIALLERRDLGNMLLHQQKLEAAEREFAAILEQNPENTQVREFLGTALMGQGKWAQARDQLLRAVVERPALYTSHYNLARCYTMLGDPAAALLHLEAAAHHNPRYVEAVRDLALQFARMHEAVKAHACLVRCRELCATSRSRPIASPPRSSRRSPVDERPAPDHRTGQTICVFHLLWSSSRPGSVQ
ncbi:MAG: sulfatase-like hydrolase/transferase [Planctomycetota bacterium]